MKIDVVSDLHVDLWGWKDPFRGMEGGDVLVIAGDSANDPQTSMATAKEALKGWRTVLVIDGNHEHYTCYRHNTTVDDNTAWMRRQCEQRDGLRWLTPDGWERDGERILGTNGWYCFRGASSGSQEQQKERWRRWNSDWGFIRFGAVPPEQRADLSAHALQRGLDEAEADDDVESVVIVTHTIPRRGTPYNGSYARPPDDTLSGSFVNVWMEDVHSPKLKAWVFGHTHEPVDCMHLGVRYVCNPRGYPFEREGAPYRPIRIEL